MRNKLNITDEYNLEYRGRSNAVPAQPEVEKEKGGPRPKPQAASSKRQAPSKKELDSYEIPDIK